MIGSPRSGDEKVYLNVRAAQQAADETKRVPTQPIQVRGDDAAIHQDAGRGSRTRPQGSRAIAGAGCTAVLAPRSRAMVSRIAVRRSPRTSNPSDLNRRSSTS